MGKIEVHAEAQLQMKYCPSSPMIVFPMLVIALASANIRFVFYRFYPFPIFDTAFLSLTPRDPLFTHRYKPVCFFMLKRRYRP
jgi:hypothetical protein